MRQTLRGFDHKTTASIQGKPDWLRPFMLVFSALGSPAVVVPPTFIIALLQIRTTHKELGLALLIACSSSIISELVKFVPRRIRPDTPYVQRMLFKTYSFPSSHAFSSAVIYGLAASLAFTSAPHAWAVPVSLSLVALIIIIGFSRIYLGAHYVLDVLGGWLLAGGVLMLLMSFLTNE